MDSAIAETPNAARAEEPSFDLERECETWNWARAAGISAQDLRLALRESSAGPDAG